eukprot:NODE_934_length_3016_cov_1.575591.p4 type:complete len:137 gc:universal NODE_934_length_3016_cov_1.575591:1419-1009(-)
MSAIAETSPRNDSPQSPVSPYLAIVTSVNQPDEKSTSNQHQNDNSPILSPTPTTAPQIEAKNFESVYGPVKEVTNLDPSKTIEYSLSVVLSKSVDGSSTFDVYKTETFAIIRPIYHESSAASVFWPFLILILFGIF